MMWPLLLCSLAAAAVGAERFLYYRGRRSDMAALEEGMKAGRSAFLAALRQDGGSAAKVVLAVAEAGGPQAAQTFRLESAASMEQSRLLAHLPLLRLIVTLAPLLGLLGTVIGMIRSFRVLSAAGSAPFAVTGGVAEALVCTAFGLFAAIVALLLHSYLSQQAEAIEAETEQLANEYLASLAESGS